MWILALAVLVIAGFALPKLGRVLLMLTGIGAVLALAFGVLVWREDKASAERVRLASTLVPPEQVELIDLKLVTQGSSQYLRGRVRNRSARYTLESVTLKLTFSDCATDGSCEVVAEHSEYLTVDIPPGQARDVDQFFVGPSALRPRGRLTWSYAVERTYAH